MNTGKQLAGLLLLTTALTFPGIAAAQDTGDSDPTVRDLPEPQSDDPVDPGDDEPDQPDISIPGGDIIVTGRINRNPERSATQVVNVLSTEQIARTGEGDIAGALSRVTGLSVQGDGFVFVRGLGDRYSLALLNGLPLPSPQPLSRVVPLDIFPTNVVASSLVQKTYSANFPGEFGGGVINLTTRAIPDESFIEISAGVSANTETTFHNGLAYYGSDFDWFGFDDGTRDAPPALQTFFDSGLRMSDVPQDASRNFNDAPITQEAIAQQLGNPNLILLQKIGDIPANWSAGLTAGTSTDIFSDGRLGVVLTGSISNSWRTRDITSQTILADFSLDSDFNDLVTDNSVLVNGLLGIGLEVADHRFRWTNVFIRDTSKFARLSQGEDFQDDDSIQQQQTAWFERQLINSQLVAELEFGDLGIDLRGGYARTDREAPFEYTFTYVRDNAQGEFSDSFINVLDRQTGDAAVVFSDLQEELYAGGVDVSYPIFDSLVATVGYAYSDTERYSERREFLFNAPTSFPDAIGNLRPDLLLGDAIIDFYDIGLIESTQSDPAFEAGLTVHAGYGKINWEPIFGVQLDVGVRYEDAVQTVDPVNVFATPLNSTSSTNLENDYWLPAATLTVEPIEDLQLRAHASRTLARPQFRELIFQTYFDPETNRQFNGNPFLVDSELTNYELRAEYYFGGQNSVSLAGFYKQIEDPIEAFSSFSDNAQLTSFANAPEATLWGIEADLQYTFDLVGLGGFFSTKDLLLIGNYTYTDSEITVGPDDITRLFPGGDTPASNLFQDGVPLTGQSDHLANFQVTLEDIDQLQQITFLLAYASERVTSRGTSGLPDIVEDPGITFDIVARQGFELGGTEMEFKLEARNIFGQRNEEFQTDGVNRAEINTFDRGTELAASISVTF
ncbi:TonB-dependent receptor domain-containing protein [Aurantiacibacter gangjinensis]|uniref:TonB-dependent receptor n=1 Tax=Aurantiacibacter gangjinensis TaxID=502682 RepID=A0A0G9MR94_9SPHN|nr:TonB-dependent receptor [Aurantiacibacter gangjinensis]APE27859.1 TonB-dependent receptor [Aurantiacibacter gangjinensis]KLE31833.1 TonB-dependent receptor [Aurantiacibacter gangjinensis]